MKITCLAVTLATLVLTLGASPACAQDAPLARSTAVSLTTQAQQDALRASIQTEADWSVALYVTAPVAFVAGSTLAFVGLFRTFAWDRSGVAEGEARAAAGIALGIVGLLALPIAIGLDVDSGSRRRGLSPELSVSLGPSSAAATLRL